LNYPLKRVGDRGQGKWSRISWDQAMDEIAGKITEIRNDYGPEAVACMGGEGIACYYWTFMRWCNLFGTPNYFHSTKNCFSPQVIAEVAMYGSDTCHQVPVPGVTKCMVVFGANPFEARPQWWSSVVRSQKEGAKLIVIDPRLTKTAQRADLWLQLRPGTDAALAYGMLNVIVREGLYDKEFVDRWCLGFDEVEALVQDYTPEKVEAITWLPKEKIIEAARIYATSRPAQISTTWGVTHSQLGKGADLPVNLAKGALRAITGNLDVEGGELIFSDLEDMAYDQNLCWDRLIDHPLRTRDNVSAERFPVGSVRGLKLFREAMKRVFKKGGYLRDWALAPNVSPYYMWQAILEEKPYPIKALIFPGLNVMCTRTNIDRVHQALVSPKLELSVVMDHFATPHGMLADYVLPATDWLERPWLEPGHHVAAEQSLPPKYERRHDYDFWRELGARLGQGEYWPETLEAMYDRFLEPAGASFAEFTRRVRWEKDASLIPDRTYKKYNKKGFATFSGKVELVPSILRKLGCELPSPFKEPPRSPFSTPVLAESYPLILITGGRTRIYFHSTLREEPKLRQRHPDPLVQIHPETAKRFDIAPGDWVYIETPEGRIKQKAEVTRGILPGVVHIEHGWWFPEQAGEEPRLFGVWESNAGVILPDEPEYCDYQGGPPMRALLCRISRAELP